MLAAATTLTDEARDLELEGRVLLSLCDRSLPNLRRLDVEVREGVVTLRGRVASFHEKQMALHYSRRVSGTCRLIDEIEVQG